MSYGLEKSQPRTVFRGEYIWIDGYSGLRSKTKIVRCKETDSPNLFEIFGSWNFDGSSTHQATTESSEVHLKPVLILPDAERTPKSCALDINALKSCALDINALKSCALDINALKSCALDIQNYLVLCETYCDSALKKPHPSNTRYAANKIMEQFADQKPLFGIEQEFFLFDNVTGRPLDWTPDLMESSLPSGTSCLLGDKSTFPSFSMRHDNTGKERHYCSVGAGKVSHRDLLESVVNEMLALDFNITGMNYEVAPGQAEIQICEYGIKAADHLVLLRYLLARAAERENLRLDISAKPIKNGEWNGSGCHVNFSTEAMRNDGGYDVIMACMPKLAIKHEEHIACYGEDNNERLTGRNETSSMHVFNYGVGHRGASVRIPSTVVRDGKGYFEDRRPSGCMDPYKVTSKILETVCL